MLVSNTGAACALTDCRIEPGANHKLTLYLLGLGIGIGKVGGAKKKA